MAEPDLRDDREHVGHAFLRLAEARETAPAVALRFGDDTFLDADGRRRRSRHLFATEAIGSFPTREFRLGPAVTAHVREAEVVTLIETDGGVLCTLVWEGIRVPPLAGAGARLGAGGRGKPARPGAAVPVFTAGTSAPNPIADRAGPGPAAVPAPAMVAPKGLRVRSAAMLVVPLLALLLALAAVLAGLVGWHLEPREVAFAGPPGGAFAPGAQRARLVLAWYARPLLASAPIPIGGVPNWVTLRQEHASDGWTLVLAPAATARALPPGAHEARLPLAFPLRTVADALAVSLDVTPTGPAAPAKVAVSTIDDACDRLAGNRFDNDHSATAGFTEEIFTLSKAELDAGLAACDPNPARTGPDRRFAVQRGRLLSHLALVRLAAKDIAGATSAMDAAVALWRHGDAIGSAYAANLLGAYVSGTYNRSGHAFVTPDDRAANALWKRAMEAGNVVAERNYAAHLLVGSGVEADPAHAVALLRDAASQGDLHASGVLGVAFYTGSPPGVAPDRAEGWLLIVAAQCVNPGAAALVERAVAGGTQPASARHDCR